MKLLAFAASSSRNSINKKLVTFASSLMADCDSEILDLNDFELPLFSQDREAELGAPDLAKQFVEKIAKTDALLISFAEHNGSYTAAYKNLFDWCSRIEKKLFQDKPMVMLSTSPGARGASTVLETAVKSAPFFGGDVKASLSIPSFYENFDVEAGKFINDSLLEELRSCLALLAK